MGLLTGKLDRTTYHPLRKPLATRSFNKVSKAWHRPFCTSKSMVVCSAGPNQIGNGGEPRRSRLIPLVLSIPRRLDRYFDQYPIRRGVWCVISAGAGFYAGNIATLSFGALAINDVFAAIVTLLFYEIVSNLFYGAKRPSLKLWFANFFKIGMTASMIADAVKLGG